MVKDEAGFTLIELLAVMVVLGLLAAVGIPAFAGQRDRGYDACAKAQLRTTMTAMETYYLENNRFDTADLAALHALEGQVPATAGGGCDGSDNFHLGADMSGDACAETTPATGGYCVFIESASGGRPFILARSDTGRVIRTCGDRAGGIGDSGNGGDCSSGLW